MSVTTPDLAGFVDAQNRKRQYLGRDVRFYQLATLTYAPGVPTDEEGQALDPLAVPTTESTLADVEIDNLTYCGSAHCNVVFRSLQTSLLRRDQTQETPLAIRSGLDKDLILGIADAPVAQGADYFQVGTMARDALGNVLYPEQWTADEDELWKIVSAKADGLGELQRYVVYGRSTA